MLSIVEYKGVPKRLLREENVVNKGKELKVEVDDVEDFTFATVQPSKKLKRSFVEKTEQRMNALKLRREVLKLQLL